MRTGSGEIVMGADEQTVPPPWGAVLLLGVLATALVALGPGKGPPPARMRRNGAKKKKEPKPQVFVFTHDTDVEGAPTRGTIQDAVDWALESGGHIWLSDTSGRSQGHVTHDGDYEGAEVYVTEAQAREAGWEEGERAASRFAQRFVTLTGTDANWAKMDAAASREADLAISRFDEAHDMKLTNAAREAFGYAYQEALSTAGRDAMR